MYNISQEIPDIDFATLDLLPYGIIVVDQTGVIIYYNNREEEISRRKKEDVIGRNFFSEVAPCAQVKEFYGRFKDTMEQQGATASFHFKFMFKHYPRDVDICLTSFKYQDAPLCLIAVNDVTEENLVRERILRAERLREIGEVSAEIAHNFNNILTTIKGYAELLIQQGALSESARAHMDYILKAAKDGTEMVKRLKANSIQQPAQKYVTGVYLDELVKDSLAYIVGYLQQARNESGKEIRVELDLQPERQIVEGNAGELREVMVNLLINAVDAIQRQGVITVRTSISERYKLIQVSDTGVGMSQEVKEKLFQPLFTTKGEKGTGLGLSSSYAIIHRHRGELDVDSKPGEGTTFTVRLP